MILESRDFDGYVYSLDKSGMVIERKATITKYITQDESQKTIPQKHALATISKHQRLILGLEENDIYNNVMWSSTPNKNLYIAKMSEILIARGDEYKKKLADITRKLKILEMEYGDD